jgi:hypothetical protein
MNRKRALIAVLVSLMLVIASGALVCAGELDSIPLDINLRIVQPEKTLLVEAKTGSGVPINLPVRGMLAIDFAVEEGKELSLMLLTKDQSSTLLAGKKPAEGPIMRSTIKGTDSRYKLLNRGEYVIYIGNDAPTNTTLTYRVTLREK